RGGRADREQAAAGRPDRMRRRSRPALVASARKRPVAPAAAPRPEPAAALPASRRRPWLSAYRSGRSAGPVRGVAPAAAAESSLAPAPPRFPAFPGPTPAAALL